MLLGLTEPSAGHVRVLDLNPVRQPLLVKARAGYLPERLGFYDNLTARENLAYTARLNGLSSAESVRRIDAALAQMSLSDVADRRVAAFSRGMRQRLGLADVLIKQPRLIIMDEPTQGLDPQAAREFLEIIRRFKDEGITILLASHLLHQVQAVCDRVGLFHQGQLVLEGTVPELARQVLGGAYRIQVEVEGERDLVSAFEQLSGVLNVAHVDGNRYELEARSDLRPEAAEAVVQAGGRLLSLEAEAPGLDEIYSHYFAQKEVTHATAG
jgi:ABC-2 type transport system ATP-binding protein